MLRILSILFFAAGVLEVILMIIGKLNLSGGLAAISFALFFGGVIYGLAGIKDDLQAIRSRMNPSESQTEDASL
jgi:hypothetical protein